jgi:hypothetical protein
VIFALDGGKLILACILVVMHMYCIPFIITCRCLPSSEEVDLINVAFEQTNAKTRQSSYVNVHACM